MLRGHCRAFWHITISINTPEQLYNAAGLRNLRGEALRQHDLHAETSPLCCGSNPERVIEWLTVHVSLILVWEQTLSVERCGERSEWSKMQGIANS